MGSPKRHASDRTVERVEAFDDRFADNLRAAREAAGLSRVDLSRLTGIPWHAIEKIEVVRSHRSNLRRRVTIGEAVVLAEALGMTPGSLLRDPAVVHA